MVLSELLAEKDYRAGMYVLSYLVKEKDKNGRTVEQIHNSTNFSKTYKDLKMTWEFLSIKLGSAPDKLISIEKVGK